MQPTFGVLAGMAAYTTVSLNQYLSAVFRGISTAANQHGCNLLLACGIYPPDSSNNFRSSWPVVAPENNFVPVGPWNTNGLIVVSPLMSRARSRYMQTLMAGGHPVVFVGSGEVGPTVAPDNYGAVQQAISHLIQHGHRRIAFVAGFERDPGDSTERLHAYQTTLREYGLQPDPNLIVYGNHTRMGGNDAMQELLARNIPFTAVLCSNDPAAKGALEILQQSGRRVPDDVALIGIDDQLDARSTFPSLTTIHHPMFEMGYRALELALEATTHTLPPTTLIRVPTRLVVRHSCGCTPETALHIKNDLPELNVPQYGPAYHRDAIVSSDNRSAFVAAIVEVMTNAVAVETRVMGLETIRTLCRQLMDGCLMSLKQDTSAAFRLALTEILWQVEVVHDDPQAWQAAISVLRQAAPLLTDAFATNPAHALDEWLDQARIVIGVSERRQYGRQYFDQDWAEDMMTRLTTRLVAVMDETQIMSILETGLPEVGIHQAKVFLYEAEASDLAAWSVLLGTEGPAAQSNRFPSYNFPPTGLYPTDKPFSLALLPLVSQPDEKLMGFMAFEAGQFSRYAAVAAHYLAVAFRSARLYREAQEARRLAEEANRVKSRFLSMVSHELRTPLSLIVGLSEIALHDHTPGLSFLPEAYQQDLERIYTQASHLDGLIRDVLDLAQSDFGQLQFVPEALDLGEVLKVVTMVGERMAHNKGLVWQTHIPAQLPPVWGDRTRLRQVMLNLIGNAVKFTFKGAVTLNVNVCAPQVVIEVTDTGVGIPSDEQSLIFEEFRQSQRTASHGYGGLGLGLAICKRLVELHGGEIGVRSGGDESTGSTFYVQLPVLESGLAVHPIRQHKVLLLHDSSGHENRVRAYLHQRGFEVEERWLSAKVDWWPQVWASPPGVVVLNLQTAERGWEFFKIFKENPTTRDIPILFYSLMHEQDTGTVLEFDYLTKPIGSAKLAEALKRQGLLEIGGHDEKTILIVDDEPRIRDMHVRMVQTQAPHYRVLQAESGVEALTLARELSIDLILLDLSMPEMDGFAVLEALRDGETTHDIPVIILTAQLLTEVEMARLNRGVAAILNKGVFTVDETLAHVEATLSRNRKLKTDAQHLVRKAMAYIHRHYSWRVTRESLARHVGVSDDYLTRCFQQELKLSPMTYLTRYRMNQAKTLLAQGDMKIIDVALAVGFATPTHFSRVFHQEVGISPNAYRQGQRPGSLKPANSSSHSEGSSQHVGNVQEDAAPR